MKTTNILFLPLAILLFLSAGCSENNAGQSDAELFPFLISYGSLGEAVSMEHLLDAPAGGKGFIRIEEGRFVNDAGHIQFNGTNLTGPANFPTHEEADRLAARLAQLGINCVRLHYFDTEYGNFKDEAQQGIIAEDAATQRNLDAAQLEKMDYMIAAFKKKGIYVNINLHVGRAWDERDGFADKDKRPHLDKGLDNYEPQMIELQKEYARKLLTHVNPHTGIPYTDEPCVAMVEINNENALFNQYHRGFIDKLPETYLKELQRQWNAWLRKKYPARQGEAPLLGNGADAPEQTKRDFYQFLTDTEEAYWTGMYRFLKDELKVKQVISGTQLGYSTPFVQAEMDYIDNHAYWCHPGPVNKDWLIKNISMVNSMNTIKNLAAQRIHGYPYTISEYNHPFPNQYGAEGQLMLRAYGRLQGWDGVFEYTYNHRSEAEPVYNNYFFSLVARTDVLAHFPACAALYLRGDVKEARSSVVAPLEYPEYFGHLVAKKTVRYGIDTKNMDQRYSLMHKTAVDLNKKPDAEDFVPRPIAEGQKIFTSDTEELVWNTEIPDSGYFTANTAHTKLFTGFPAGRQIQLGNVGLAVGKTRLDWATITLTSRNAAGFGEAGSASNILLCATGLTENKGMVIEQKPDDKITLSNWGGETVLTEGIPATITLPSDPAKTKCFALNPEGKRTKEVPVGKGKDSGSVINIGPRYKTIWYEIVIQ